MATSLPGRFIPPAPTHTDKIAHFVLYGVFATLLVRVVVNEFAGWRSMVLVSAFVAAFGAVDEWHQRFIPGRTTELGDWEADTFGGIIGALGAAISVRSAKPSQLT